MLANAIKATPCFDCLLELVEVKGALVNAREAGKTITMLFVELGQLVEVVEVGTCPWLISVN